jgi:hypothetical protein
MFGFIGAALGIASSLFSSGSNRRAARRARAAAEAQAAADRAEIARRTQIVEQIITKNREARAANAEALSRQKNDSLWLLARQTQDALDQGMVALSNRGYDLATSSIFLCSQGDIQTMGSKQMQQVQFEFDVQMKNMNLAYDSKELEAKDAIGNLAHQLNSVDYQVKQFKIAERAANLNFFGSVLDGLSSAFQWKATLDFQREMKQAWRKDVLNSSKPYNRDFFYLA